MKHFSRLMLGASATLTLAACATDGDAPIKSASANSAEESLSEAPFPSTYKPYPGVPTALVGATVYDGAGGVIEGGTVLFRDGKVEAVGAGLDTSGYTVIDGKRVKDDGILESFDISLEEAQYLVMKARIEPQRRTSLRMSRWL